MMTLSVTRAGSNMRISPIHESLSVLLLPAVFGPLFLAAC